MLGKAKNEMEKRGKECKKKKFFFQDFTANIPIQCRVSAIFFSSSDKKNIYLIFTCLIVRMKKKFFFYFILLFL